MFYHVTKGKLLIYSLLEAKFVVLYYTLDFPNHHGVNIFLRHDRAGKLAVGDA